MFNVFYSLIGFKNVKSKFTIKEKNLLTAIFLKVKTLGETLQTVCVKTLKQSKKKDKIRNLNLNILLIYIVKINIFIKMQTRSKATATLAAGDATKSVGKAQKPGGFFKSFVFVKFFFV